MNNSKEQYFLGILLPHHLAENVISIKKYFSENYGSSKALNSPPHLTIIPPFYADAILENKVESYVETLTKGILPFNVKLNGFGAFDKKVIFIDVEKSEALVNFENTISDFFKKTELKISKSHGSFHPHVTLAFRDLTTENFKSAWSHYKNKPFEADFEVSALHLLKHQDKVWNVVKEFSFF